MMKIGAILVGVGATDYDIEWQEFQNAQGRFINGDIPETFVSNVDFVRMVNHEQTFQLSWTGPFADWSHEEFQDVLGFSPDQILDDVPSAGLHVAGGDAPATMDWTSAGAVSQVKDQGHCGSCWAFSTTGVVESHWYLATGHMLLLSEQQLLDCDKRDGGCVGGRPDRGIFHLHEHGAASADSYPYVAKSGGCKSFTPVIPAGAITHYREIFGEVAIMDAVATAGPVSVGLFANHYLKLYSLGIFNGPCNEDDPNKATNHAVLAVGYGTENGVDYWKIKNSWGSSWGMSGYFLLQRGVNRCNLPSKYGSWYPVISAAPAPTGCCSWDGGHHCGDSEYCNTETRCNNECNAQWCTDCQARADSVIQV